MIYWSRILLSRRGAPVDRRDKCYNFIEIGERRMEAADAETGRSEMRRGEVN